MNNHPFVRVQLPFSKSSSYGMTEDEIGFMSFFVFDVVFVHFHFLLFNSWELVQTSSI